MQNILTKILPILSSIVRKICLLKLIFFSFKDKDIGFTYLTEQHARDVKENSTQIVSFQTKWNIFLNLVMGTLGGSVGIGPCYRWYSNAVKVRTEVTERHINHTHSLKESQCHWFPMQIKEI